MGCTAADEAAAAAEAAPLLMRELGTEAWLLLLLRELGCTTEAAPLLMRELGADAWLLLLRELPVGCTEAWLLAAALSASVGGGRPPGPNFVRCPVATAAATASLSLLLLLSPSLKSYFASFFFAFAGAFAAAAPCLLVLVPGIASILIGWDGALR
jgi:hypothetical protein